MKTEVSLEVDTCAACGITFGVPLNFQESRKNDHRTFWCPNGHTLSYKAKSEAERLQEKLDWEKDLRIGIERQRDAAQRSASSYKGQVTRLKNRAAAGICPCCNRHFVNLERHIKGQHPQFVAEAGRTINEPR